MRLVLLSLVCLLVGMPQAVGADPTGPDDGDPPADADAWTPILVPSYPTADEVLGHVLGPTSQEPFTECRAHTVEELIECVRATTVCIYATLGFAEPIANPSGRPVIGLLSKPTFIPGPSGYWLDFKGLYFQPLGECTPPSDAKSLSWWLRP